MYYNDAFIHLISPVAQCMIVNNARLVNIGRLPDEFWETMCPLYRI